MYNVDIGEFFHEKSSDIIINQHNSDNKDHSVNSVIVLLTDRETVEQLVGVLKERMNLN